MIKLLEIEDEYFLFRLPTSYFSRFDLSQESRHITLRKPTFNYKFNVLLEQNDPILDLRTPIHCNMKQESRSPKEVNLSFESVSETFTHDILIYFQTTALGRTDVYV